MAKVGGQATVEKYGREFYQILNQMVQIHKQIKKIEHDGNIEELGTIRQRLSQITRKYSRLIRDRQ